MNDLTRTGTAADGDPIDLLRLLVSIPSVNPSLSIGGQGEEAISDACANLLVGWGLEVVRDEVAPGRWNVVGRLSGDPGPTLLLNGHLDTVGVEGMEIDPFDPIVEEGRLFGRGSCDMKAGVAAILAAAATISRSGGPPRGELIVALTCDEEHASIGMQALLKKGLHADAAIVCEPTELAVMPANKGFVWLELESKGVAAHGSRPDVGVDAIRAAAQYLAALEPLHEALARGEGHPLLGHGSFHAGTIQGGVAPSVYPERCVLTIERRTLPGEDRDNVLAPFLDALKAVEANDRASTELQVGLERSATEVDADVPVVVGLLSALQAEGLPIRVDGMTAWVESALLNDAGIPAVCFGPGSIAQAHAAVEWVELDQLRHATRVLERCARRFLGSE